MALPIDQARDICGAARRIAVLTGAGISAESGIQTFRDAGGLWENHRLEEVATPEGFRRDPEKVWLFYNARRKAAKAAAPNPAHLALARRELTILTQNIDGLHQQAGSRRVIELHGSVWLVRCTDCGHLSDQHPLELPILPTCAECAAPLRPHIVWFGENLDPDVLEAADHAVRECDLLLVVGTSAVVQPAASYPLLALRRGVPVIEINLEETPLTPVATLSLKGPAGKILPEILPD